MKIAKYANECGTTNAVSRYKKEFPKLVETTIQGWLIKYRSQLKNAPQSVQEHVTIRAKRGRPLLLSDDLNFKLRSSLTNLRVVQYTRTESDRLRYAPTRLAGSPMARDLENKRITRVMSLERVGEGRKSRRIESIGHGWTRSIFTNTDPTSRKSDAGDLENKCITRVMSLQRVGKVGGSSRSDTDGHDPSLRRKTRLAGSPMARDLEYKHITRVMSLQRVGKVGGSSRSDTDGHDPSLRTPIRLAGSPMARDLENKRIYRIMFAEGRKSLRIESIGHGWIRSVCDCVRLRETKNKKTKRMI